MSAPTTAKCAIHVEMKHGEPSSQFLWEYHKELPIADNIWQIVKRHNEDALEPLPVNGHYALKLGPDPKRPNPDEHFISEETADQDIQDGYTIKLVPSVQETVRRLFDVQMDNEWLLQLSHDLLFIQEIVEKGRQSQLIEFIQSGRLSDDGESGALNILYHLLKNGYLRNLTNDFMVKIVNMAHYDRTSSLHAISLLIYILRTTREGLAGNKTIVMDNLKVPHIMKNFKQTNYLINDDIGFFLRLFCLINALIACTKAERRKAILEELNTQENRRIFYEFLKNHRKLNDVVAREVFVLQARLMTNSYFGFYTNRATVTSSIFEDAHTNRSSSASDYDYLDGSNRNTMLADGIWVSNLEKAESMCSILSLTSMSNKSQGSPLLNRCLDYGKNYYKTYFDSLEKSDYSCDAELFTISQNIISILTNLLCIGIPVHAHNYYLPIFFAPQTMSNSHGTYSIGFFEELFVKTLMLLFHTKAEMRVKTNEDFKKLYQVLKKQLKLTFEQHPLDFETFDMLVSGVSYSKLQEILQKERDQRWKKIYTQNESVCELVKQCSEKNLQLIATSRYIVMQKGFVFKNMSMKGKYFFLTLTPDYQSLFYAECGKDGVHIYDGHKVCIPISGIKYVVNGEKSNLRANNTVPASKTNCVFTIVYNLMDYVSSESIDCYFNKDDLDNKHPTHADLQREMETLTALWKDGLNLLTGKGVAGSAQMQAELDELNELDCKMQLIELQDIEIPMHPPPPPPKFQLGAF